MSAMYSPVVAALPREHYVGRRTTIAAIARKALWRSVFWLTGGIRVVGELPPGPVVVVANHSSHADTAALLAALPARRRPVFAAAVDYWFVTWWRRFIVETVVAALPVARGCEGAYEALEAAAAPVLADGGIVVLFPEGTRSVDGTVAPFRSGAVRLARAAGVPIVPVTLVGTARLLPKHGRFRFGAIEVRIGTAMNDVEALTDTQACTLLHDQVVANAADVDVKPFVSRFGAFVAARANARSLLAISFAWGIAEALSWPVLAEMFLVLWLAATPRRIPLAALGLWLGSVVGVVLHAELSRHGIEPPLPLTTGHMRLAAAHDLSGGARGMMHQALSGIPVKVFAAQAGIAHLNLCALACWTAIERGLRIATVAALLWCTTTLARPLFRRFYGSYAIAAAVIFAILLHQTVASWR